MKTVMLLASALAVLSTAGFLSPGHSAVVSPSEALAVADHWYAAEIKSPHWTLDEAQKTARLASISRHEILAIDPHNELRRSLIEDEGVRAYVVLYPDVGFVVVSADDRLHPVIAFDAGSPFTWGPPGRDFLRYFVEKSIRAATHDLRAAEAMGTERKPHPQWTFIRDAVRKGGAVTLSRPIPSGAPLYILLPTARWGQGVPYNQAVSAHNGNDAAIPVGCVATALAITLRYHSWPPTGTGAHDYCDDDGTVQFCHAVNFGALNLNWGNMPTSAFTAPNPEVADLIYACGVMVDMDYEAGGSGANCRKVERVTQHFSYRGIDHIGGDFEQHIVASLRAELPVPGCNPDHAFVIDGYRSDPSPFFHINAGWAGPGNAWYNLDLTPDGARGAALGEALPYMAPTAYVYADGLQRHDAEGTPTRPFRTLAEGIQAVPTGGQVWLRSGTYRGEGNAPITISKPLTLRAYYQGPVTIGP